MLAQLMEIAVAEAEEAWTFVLGWGRRDLAAVLLAMEEVLADDAWLSNVAGTC